MEKTPAHFRAAHPLLFIASILMGSLVFASVFMEPYYSISRSESVGLLIATLLILQLCIAHPSASFYQGIIVLLILFCWGILLFFITQEKNLLHLPYPEKFILFCRNAIIAKLNATLVSKEANGFAQALLLGVKSDLNKEILKAYTQLGIIHIVAISGMHLEIIFKNVTAITQWLPRKKIFIFLELVIVLASVWTYTLMAFASPSIVRACVFFCIYFMGKYLDANSFTLNAIAAGILLLLLFDVKSIQHIGLQLSYAAVVGIHLFYPLFKKMMPMQHPTLVFLWSNFCITLSAQLTTLPILVFHFHQLASLVIVSNFIMVPLSSLLLYALALLVLTPPIAGLPFIIGQIIEKYIIGMNKAISYLYSTPLNNSISLSFSWDQVLVFYLALLLLYRWLYTKSASNLLYLAGLFCCYTIIKLFSQG